jgi:catechol 2,3-dioxygenase-like lactoylglutathione lyase family enzyme
MNLSAIEIVTLFVDDIDSTKAFYRKVFSAETLFEDDASAVAGVFRG